MTETQVLGAAARDRVGKGGARAVRRDGRIPAVIYGNREESRLISLDGAQLAPLLNWLECCCTPAKRSAPGISGRRGLLKAPPVARMAFVSVRRPSPADRTAASLVPTISIVTDVFDPSALLTLKISLWMVPSAKTSQAPAVT